MFLLLKLTKIKSKKTFDKVALVAKAQSARIL